MKKIYLLLLISLPCFLHAQRKLSRKQERDSLRYYQQELGRLYRETIDSLHHSEAYMSTAASLNRLRLKDNGYGGFMIFMDVFHSDYRQFNEMLAQDGFAPLNEFGYRIGVGFSIKNNRTIFDMNLMAMSFNNKTTKENEKVHTSLNNLFSFDLGYDMLNKDRISIYPYGGLGFRFSQIRYLKNDMANPDYSSITDMISGGENVVLHSTRIGYQLGVGFDFTLSRRESAARTILFLKAGINRPLWKDKYKYNDLPEYNTGIKNGDYVITAGFKFVGN